jgi:CheY-like chemotaxis protein
MPQVLIVEDDPDLRELLESLLQHHGYSTDTACHGAEALERAERCPPSLVLLDLAMPVMNGWQFRERQLQTPAIADVPVICVTAECDANEKGDVLGAPCLRKPIDMDTVMKAVRKACGTGLVPDVDVLKRYDAWRGVEVIGDWFVLERDDRQARCEVRTHPLGWELRLSGVLQDGFDLTQVCRTRREVFDTGDSWKAKLLLKGWQT